MSFWEAVTSFLIGIGGSLFTPAQLGELTRAIMFKGKRGRALILALIDKLIDLIGLCSLFLLSMLILNRRVGMILGMGGLIALITFAIWWGGSRREEPGFLLPFFSLQFLLSLTCFLLLMLQFWVILLDFGDVGFVDVLAGLPVILVGSMFPLSVSGLGLREMIASLILPRFGIDRGRAAIGSFLLFLTNSLLPGLVGIALGGNKIRSLYGRDL